MSIKFIHIFHLRFNIKENVQISCPSGETVVACLSANVIMCLLFSRDTTMYLYVSKLKYEIFGCHFNMMIIPLPPSTDIQRETREADRNRSLPFRSRCREIVLTTVCKTEFYICSMLCCDLILSDSTALEAMLS